jgi:PAS domain S-box-containing protein
MTAKPSKETKNASPAPGERERERLTHLASFPELNPNPVTEVDLTGHFHYLNPAAERLFPDLQAKGLQHPWLKDLTAIAKMFGQTGERSYTREIKIDESWYHQSIIPVLEGKRLQIFSFNITVHKQAEEALRSSAERYRGLYEAMSGGVIMQDREGAILGANAAACEILGLTEDQIQTRTLRDPRWRAINEDGTPSPNDDLPAMRALRTGIPVRGQVIGVFNPALEQYRWLLVNAEPILDPRTSQVQAVVSTFLDITDRKNKEEELQRLNRTLTALSKSSKAMMRATDEAEYLQDVCRIVVEDCGHKMVWIGFAEEDEGKTVRPAASAGFEQGYLETLRITWADTKRGRGPTGTAIRTKKVTMCRNMFTDPNFAPWREQAIKRGYASSIVLPLMAEGRAFGAINIYSKDADPFSDDAVKLLSELADDLALGITTLRLRAAHEEAQEALRQSEERLRLAQASANVGVWDWNPQTRELVFTPELEELLGLTPGTIKTYGDWSQRVLPDDLARSEAERKQAIAEHKQFDQEFRVFHSTGDVRWIAAKGGALYNEAGEAIRVFGVLLDITERKRVEQALRESEERFRVIASSTPDHLLRQDCELRYTYVINPQLGLSVEDMLGKTDYDFLDKTDADRLTAIKRRVLDTGETVSLESSLVDTRGGLQYFEGSYVPALDENKQITGLIGYFKNITERKRAEEAVLRAKQEWERTFDAVPDLIAILDDQHRVIRANRAMAARLGVSPQECIGKVCHEVVHGSDCPPEFCPHSRSLADGREHVAEVHEERLGGDFLVSTTPLMDAQGKLLGAVHVARDITERKQMEDELLRSRDELEARVEERTAELRSVVEALQDEMVQRTQAEEDAKAERQRFNNVLEILPAYVVLLTQDYHVPFANRVFRERFGESQGRRCFEYLFGRSKPCEICETYTVLKTMVPHHWEWLGPDNHTYDVFDYPFTDVDGSTMILEMGIDITERKQAEKALRDASVYARGLLEASLDPLVTISAEGKVTDVNKATELITGIPRDRLTGSDFSDYFTEPDKARAGYQKVFREGSVRDYPLAIRDTKGHVTEVLYNATVYKDEAGEVLGVFAAARDISALKAAEEERVRLIAAIEQSGESVVITDHIGKIMYANTGFGSINDYASAEARGKNYFDILTGDGRDTGFKKRLVDILGKGSIWKDHFTREKKDGSSYELDVSISPVRDHAGKVINYSIIERDVTREAVLEQHLRQQQKMEALGTLAGGIAHDFNNILMPIIINTELSLYDTPQASPIKQYLNTALQAAQRGQELVKQITAFSRRREQERSPIKITPVVKETLKFLKTTAPQGIEIREHFAAESGMILADPTQIHQVLMNLCSNAVHAMRAKGGVLEVSLGDVEVDVYMFAKHRDLKPGPYLKLTVSDTGSGMDQETAKRIFDPFFTTKKPGEGTGMGLAVVHGIVKRHEGSIITDSEPGKGSTFHVYFPRIEGEPRAERAEPEAIPMGTERILFVDDEEAQARSGWHLLERLGYDVTTSTDSLEALETFRAQPDAFDLVITDQRMPGLTGMQLAAELMQIRSDISIILCTGFSEVVDGNKAKAGGIREFMMKPFSARQLAETIRRVLGKRD